MIKIKKRYIYYCAAVLFYAIVTYLSILWFDYKLIIILFLFKWATNFDTEHEKLKSRAIK